MEESNTGVLEERMARWIHRRKGKTLEEFSSEGKELWRNEKQRERRKLEIQE